MNLHCKLIWGILGMITFVSGCVKNDSDSCGFVVDSEGLELYFYSRTICQTDTKYPAEINDITYGIFDENNILIDHSRIADVTLSNNYTQRIETGSGLYTVAAWSGINETNFTIADLRNGITNKNELFFRLKREGNVVNSLNGTTIYYGESRAVYIPENTTAESLFEKVGINMREITNRLTVSVDGLDDSFDYEIFIESNNGSMNFDGSIADDEILIYQGIDISADTTLIVDFTTMKLQTGITNTLIIKNITEDIELFRENLLGTLLLKNPEINLACDNDFVINFTAEDQCDCGTYIITEIWVNNWLVHSYDTEM